jgi:hypothetical protein
MLQLQLELSTEEVIELPTVLPHHYLHHRSESLHLKKGLLYSILNYALVVVTTTANERGLFLLGVELFMKLGKVFYIFQFALHDASSA